jgi:hypothetical protein
MSEKFNVDKICNTLKFLKKYDDDDDDSIQFFCLFTLLLSTQKASNKVSTSKETNKHIHTNKRHKEANVYRLGYNHSIGAVTLTVK